MADQAEVQFQGTNLANPVKPIIQNPTQIQPIEINSSDSDGISGQAPNPQDTNGPEQHWISAKMQNKNGLETCNVKIVKNSESNRIYHLYMNTKLGGNQITDTYLSQLIQPKVNEKQRYACKVLEKKRFEDFLLFNKPDQKYKIQSQMKNQVLLWLKMKHNNLIEFTDYVETKNNYYFFMLYNEIGTLQGLLLKKKYLMENNALFIFKQIVEGCKYLCDMGIIHTELRPSNVLLHMSSNNQAIIARLTDFGFSKFIDQYPSQYKMLYQSPQLLANQKYSYLCDVWSVGIIFYEMITGNVPWSFNMEINSAQKLYEHIQSQKLEFPQNIMIGQDVKALISEMLQFKEEDRITIHQVLKQVNKIIQIRITRMELE